jgi:hypothetical protein
MGEWEEVRVGTPPKNFKREFNRDFRVKLTPDKLRTFCEINWPAFAVGWPSEGSLDKVIVKVILTAGWVQSSVSPHG